MKQKLRVSAPVPWISNGSSPVACKSASRFSRSANCGTTCSQPMSGP